AAAEGAVPTEVVAGKVGEDGGVGQQVRAALELEARDLAHDDVVRLARQCRQRRMKLRVAPEGRTPATRLQHRPEEMAGRRLAVRPGDRQQRAIVEPPGELRL